MKKRAIPKIPGLSADDYDSLTRIIDQEIQSRKEESKYFHTQATRAEHREGIRILERLNNKLLAMYKHQKAKEG
jgi:hypothetical protein